MGYIKPENLEDNMGGVGDKIDTRMREIFQLLEKAPNKSGKVLDIGVGRGQISEWFLNNGNPESIDAVGLETDSYGMKSDLKQLVRIRECSVEYMPYEEDFFDVVIASHILEHVPNMGRALTEICRVTKLGGWLYVFIPKYTDRVCAGHINTGWNLGQLIYVLLLNGFDVKNGHFIEYGYSLCAYVQKSDIKLPVLRGDSGDITLLNDAGLFPVPISTEDGKNDGFDGEFMSINWEGAEHLLESRLKDKDASGQRKIANSIVKMMIKLLGHSRCREIGKLLVYSGNKNINPIKLS